MFTGIRKSRRCLRQSKTLKFTCFLICIFSLAFTSRSTHADEYLPASLVEEAPPEAVACEPECEECTGPDFWSQSTLTENLFARRPCLAEQGITFDADLTQFYMGVASGGLEQEFRYSGHGDYVTNIDSGKLGGPQGLFVKLRAEHRFGEGISDATGAIIPVNVLADLPVADSTELYLTNVLFTQMFSETFGVFAGKLDTLDGDMNAFAHGRGKTQFSNAAFVATPIGLRTIVYSTLGTGFLILREGEPIFTFTVLNSTDTSRTSGFDELFANGAAVIPELRLPTNLFGRPGHFLFGASWSSRDYASLEQDPFITLPDIPIARETDSWSLYWNFDQYLFVDPCDPTRGWGVFGRAGIADDRTNPIDWFLSLGIGGNSPISSRKSDTFGLGWYYSATSDRLAPFIETALGGVGDGYGVEIFYNAEITRWFHLTADMQVLRPARQTADTALVVGLRAVIEL
ncbi:carbohydrate porin [Gimesia fumaroli]|uniref:Carbohydrate-selective porin, OprB family n=1 Tax=Gimesia fumaroli TaxID=2527976 RepID=A0A518IER4_9PLAN|nr:carbohydrate porin [Gimesia fumaroli]QDV51584.1 Carbohydrate-selective porin, OprB family [Gimesia fumaroli]